MIDDYIVTVSRKWHEPFIRIDVTRVGVGVTMSLDDFITALEAESRSSLRDAATRVIDAMKQETIKAL